MVLWPLLMGCTFICVSTSSLSDSTCVMMPISFPSSWRKLESRLIADCSVLESSVPKPSSKNSVSMRTRWLAIDESPNAKERLIWKVSPPEMLLVGRTSPKSLS